MAWFEFKDGVMRNMDIWEKVTLSEEEKYKDGAKKMEYNINLRRNDPLNKMSHNTIAYDSIEEREKEYINLKKALGAFIEG